MMERENQAVSISEKRLLSAIEVCTYLGLGMNRGVEFAKEIGSEIRVGKRCLYDKVKIDKTLNELTEV